jgi:predicted transcriptional regulator
MYKKSIILTVLLVLLNSCGYTPLYLGSSLKISIEIIKQDGDRDINNLIISNLKRFSNKSEITKKNYEIIINSLYSKKIIAKDATGKSTDYKLNIVVNFTVKSDEKTKILNFKETFNMKGLDNNFEEKEYEKVIQKNMVNTIIQKLITQLNTIK